MSATWSLTYLSTPISERELFEILTTLFRLELDGNLYVIDLFRDPYPPMSFVKLEPAIAEWFDNPNRARLIADALLGGVHAGGILIYPRNNGLLTVADSVIHSNDIDSCGRTRRAELISENADPQFYSLFK